MDRITPNATLIELAAIVSQTLEAAGVVATLSGGAAVSLYSKNAYQSYDLDFVTFERVAVLERALGPLGFRRIAGAREFRHDQTKWTVEFPAGPLAFGETRVDDADASVVQTAFGPVRIVSPTHIVMDRIAAFVHWSDRQSLDQAILVSMETDIDWSVLDAWAEREGIDSALIGRIKERASSRTNTSDPQGA